MLLNLVRSIPLPPIVTPHTLGVDDFCFRKCKTYGTALIDLERRRPIALLKDAKAETLAEWLKAHPGVKVVSRDRSKTYESGIRQGAPEAIQVADRFHLLQNLFQTLEQVFGTHAKALKEVEKQVFSTDTKVLKEVETAHNPLIAEANPYPVVPRFPQNTSLKRKVQSAKAQARRRDIHEQVWSLRSIGLSVQAIAQLQTAHSDLKSAIELAQQFAFLVRQRLPEQLDAWLNKAKNSSVSLLRSFAVSLESDYNAVKAGVTMSVSNGPVEGHINRLKMLKRQMYGRAKIDLLERRFLLAI
ncbi:MAG: ISL3 family transposase [Nostoc desertorum CM1-VF14]|nr:ISL3 family transposase [Nostoc desertorum CM1-VF14]